MKAAEAIEVVNSWRRILIEGRKEDIDRMLNDLERRLQAKGWVRNAEWEKQSGLFATHQHRFRCFVGGSVGGPQLMLTLSRVSDGRVRGGTYTLLDKPHVEQRIVGAADVDDIIATELVPAAAGAGLRVTKPRLGSCSRVTPKTAASLYAFTDLAAGMWPLTVLIEPAWRQFVITASQDDAAFDVDELHDWFVTNGWSSEQARHLVDRFVSDASLLAEYVDAQRD